VDHPDTEPRRRRRRYPRQRGRRRSQPELSLALAAGRRRVRLLNLVDESRGSTAVERRFAALAGQRAARLQREPGSIVTWEDHSFKGTAFVDELPAGRLSRAAAARFADAVAKLAGH
jgi:hypothetical protein